MNHLRYVFHYFWYDFHTSFLTVWFFTEFEELADSIIDKDDDAISGDNNNKLQNTENWEDRICCQLVLMGKLNFCFYHVSAND